MAEWSNAVDSKSIVLSDGYLGFESLPFRQFQKKPALCGFFLKVYGKWDLNPREKGSTPSERRALRTPVRQSRMSAKNEANAE